MRRDPACKPLKALFTKAFEYSDGWVDDARMVVLNAKDAALKGALIMTRSQGRFGKSARTVSGRSSTDGATGAVRHSFKARMLVNAAGPWVDHVVAAAFGTQERGP
jgi:glycerol-3-phosphate dehydrogenase